MRHQNVCMGADWSSFCWLGREGQWGHVCHGPCCREGGCCGWAEESLLVRVGVALFSSGPKRRR
jgi:hypothetical protein